MRLFLILFMVSVPGFVWSQEGDRPFTVEAAVALAVKNNPRLAAAIYDIAAAQAASRSARALTNPTFFFAPAVLGQSGADEELLFSQPLELNGVRSARSGVADAHLRTARAEALVELRNVVSHAKSAYYELARAREQLALARALLTAAEEFDRLTRRQVELGSRPGIDQTQTGIEVLRARQQVTLAEGQAEAGRALLNTQMNREPSEPVGPLAPLSADVENPDTEQAVTKGLTYRAEIAATEAGREVFRQEARLARAEGRPDLAPQFRAQSVTRGFDSGFGLAITLPLFDWGSRRNRIRQAQEAGRAQEARIAAARNLVRQEVSQALARLRAAQTVVSDYRAGVLDQARRLVEASRTGFQAGATSVLSVLEAQRTYRSVQTDYLNALVNLALARVELERATGAVSAALLPTLTPDTGRTR